MARQNGLIKIKGTLDNVSFYKTKDGDLARMKTSVDGKRIANDPAFVEKPLMLTTQKRIKVTTRKRIMLTIRKRSILTT